MTMKERLIRIHKKHPRLLSRAVWTPSVFFLFVWLLALALVIRGLAQNKTDNPDAAFLAGTALFFMVPIMLLPISAIIRMAVETAVKKALDDHYGRSKPHKDKELDDLCSQKNTTNSTLQQDSKTPLLRQYRQSGARIQYFA